MSDATDTPAPDTLSRIPLPWGLVVFGVVALMGNAVGLWLRYPEIGSAVLFPPYAVLTTALLFTPRRNWIWYIAIGTIAHAIPFQGEFAPTWILVADIANVTRALVAALLLQKLFDGPPRLVDLRSLFLFIVAAVVIAPAAAAMIGASNVLIHHAPVSYWKTWMGWFLSNALTGLTVLPALISAVANRSKWRRRIERKRAIEALLVAVGIGASSGFAFLLPASTRLDLALRFIVPLPVLIWAALRFGTGVASLALTAVAFAAVRGADVGTGPFGVASPDEKLLTLQLFLLLTTIQILCIAAISSGRQRAVQLYAALVASLREQVAVLDRRGRILAVNESWRRFIDRPGDRHFGRVTIGDDYLAACRVAVRDGDTTAERVLAGVERVLSREERGFDIEYDHHHEGAHEWYAMSVQALERADGGAVVTRVDVSARHEALSEIEAQRRELSHLARVAVLGQLSGALAHELRQPLAAILSNAEAAQYLLHRQPRNVVELEAILRDIIAENHRAGEVMGRLRALLRRGETPLQPVDPNELVSEVLELAHAELITRRVTTSAFLEPTVTPVLGNRVQLQQVLLNLILNGCEAMASLPPDERRLSLTVRAVSPTDVQVSIRDHGTGIPAHLTDRLFEAFVTSKPEGLGLGLSISRAIIAAHGGRLWAENNDDRGASVHFLLSAPRPAVEVQIERRDGPVVEQPAPAPLSA